MSSLSASSRPLVFDLDGTLLRTDCLLESGLACIRAHPMQSLSMGSWLLQGKARLKENLTRAIDLDIAHLPWHPEVLQLLAAARQEGRQVVLATATHRRIAERIAAELGGFDDILATEGNCNLAGSNKRDALVTRYGEKGFDYVGDSRADLVVWAAANKAYLVEPAARIERQARAAGNVEQVFRTPRSGLRLWSRALRSHQWLKNLLIFIPLLAAHHMLEVEQLGRALLAFVLFGLCASSVYLSNDLLDLADDRHHPRKRFRPFAAGLLPLWQGMALAPILLALSFGLALWLLPWPFALVMASYYLLTLCYSFALKRLMAVDVIVLSALYTLRIFAGATACALGVSFWMLAFSMFLFLSLAFVKRHAELAGERRKGRTERTRGRGYYPGDLEMIATLGPISGYLSVMVLALYLRDPGTLALYRHPEWIWLACVLLLFWITRIWMLAHRGEMHDDPVVFAMRDRISLCAGLLFALALYVAT